MYDVFLEALIESAKTIPLLLIVYVGIELTEGAFTRKIVEKIEQSGSAGPAVGALVGIVPQCGFSVFASGNLSACHAHRAR